MGSYTVNLEHEFELPAVPTDREPENLPTWQPPDFIRGPHPMWRKVLILAWPVLLQQCLVLLVSLSDRFLAGNFQAVSLDQQIEAAGFRALALGQLGGLWIMGNGPGSWIAASASWQSAESLLSIQAAYQAAQTNAFYMTWFLSSYTILVTVGSTALVARSIGASDRPAAIHITNQSLLLAAVLGLLGSIAGLFGLDGMIWLLQLRGESAQFLSDYLFPQFLLLVFQVLELSAIACLVGAGDTLTGLLVMTGVAILNVPLSWGLCLGLGPLPQLGFVGISWGTALSHLLGGIAVLLVLLRGRHGLRLRWDQLVPDYAVIKRLLRISIPAGFDSMSVVLGQFWFLAIVNQLGDVAISAHGIALGWEALGFLSGAAFGTAAMTLVGQYLGAEQPKQAAHSGWMAFWLGCGTMTLMGLLFFSLAEPMFHLFCPFPWQQPIVDTGIPVLRLIAFAMPPLASAIIFTSALRGAGDTAFPVLFTWIGFLLVRIPLAYWLTLPEVDLGPLGTIAGWNLGLLGAWMAMCADLILRGGLFMVRFAGGAWQKIQV